MAAAKSGQTVTRERYSAFRIGGRERPGSAPGEGPAPILDIGALQSLDQGMSLFHFVPPWGREIFPAALFLHSLTDRFVAPEHQVKTLQIALCELPVWLRLFGKHVQTVMGGGGPGDHRRSLCGET